MSNISYKDFVDDLSNVLISYLEPLKLTFSFGEQEIMLKEVFMKAGFMPVFLYDKQPFIDYQLRHKKIPGLHIDAFATIKHEPLQECYFNFKIEVVHNLVNNNLYKTDTSVYETLLFSLAHKILSEKDFVVKDQKVYLDHKYVLFADHFNANTLEKSEGISNEEGVKQ